MSTTFDDWFKSIMLDDWLESTTLNVTLQLTGQHYNLSPKVWDQESYELKTNIFHSH